MGLKTAFLHCKYFLKLTTLEIWTWGCMCMVRSMWNISYNLLIIRHFIIPSLSCLFSLQRCSMTYVQGLFQRTKREEGSTGQKGKWREKGEERNRACQEHSANSCNDTPVLNKIILRTLMTSNNINNHWELMKNEQNQRTLYALEVTWCPYPSGFWEVSVNDANQKKETFNTTYLLSPWKNTSVIVLIKNPSTFWCLIIPQYASPLCSTSIQSSSFLKVTLLGAAFSHHLAVNEWIALGTKLVEILCDSQIKQQSGIKVLCTVLSARFTPVPSGALYQNMYCMLCGKKIISCPIPNQPDHLSQ